MLSLKSLALAALVLIAQPASAVSPGSVYLPSQEINQNKNRLEFNPASLNRLAAFTDQIASSASWYGPGFYGNRTANGEIFNAGAMTAAHRSLPFGTRVRVTNLNNGRSVVVRINDRGPFVGGRVIDLSEGAASRIGLTSSGVAPVSLQVLN